MKMNSEPLRLLRKNRALPMILLRDGKREALRAESQLIRELVQDDQLLGFLVRMVIGDSPSNARITPEALAKAIQRETGCELNVAIELVDEFLRIEWIAASRKRMAAHKGFSSSLD